MKRAVIIALFVAVCCSAVFAADRGPSTQEERDRLVRVAKALEEDPTSPALSDDVSWAIRFLVEVPDIHVVMSCKSVEFLAKDKKYKYSPELTALTMIAGGRFAVENPENKDENAQALAMLQSALKGYENILKKEPKARLKSADALIAMRDNGKLSDYVQSPCGDKK